MPFNQGSREGGGGQETDKKDLALGGANIGLIPHPQFENCTSNLDLMTLVAFAQDLWLSP